MNIWPTPPSGTQFAIPIRPPGLQTRSSSAAAFSCSGGEHRAEDREDDVELGVAEGQVGGVALDELDVETLGGRALAPALEQGRDEVDADGVAPGPPRGRERRVAAAAGDVEDPLAGNDSERFDQLLRDHHHQPATIAKSPSDQVFCCAWRTAFKSIYVVHLVPFDFTRTYALSVSSSF